MTFERFLRPILGLALTIGAIATVQAKPRAGPAIFRGGSFHPAQATSVPPISTCVPLPSEVPPPGLYPLVSVDEVTIGQVFDAAGCPGVELVLRIAFRNDGPAPSGPFALRIDGCGVGRREVTVDSIDMFRTATVEIPGASIPPGPCAIMLDPSCRKLYFDRHWSGEVPHPEPLPTCTPPPAITATATETDTATATALTTEDARLLLPLLRR